MKILSLVSRYFPDFLNYLGTALVVVGVLVLPILLSFKLIILGILALIIWYAID